MNLLSQLPWKLRRRVLVVAPDEKLLRAALPHAIRYLPYLGVYLVFGSLSIGLCIAAFSASSPAFGRALFLTALAVLTVIHHWFFHAIIGLSLSNIMLTSKRMLHLTRNLWFSDVYHDLALAKINAVEAHRRGILQNILNYGDLWFDTGGSAAGEPHQTIHFVPAPQKWADEISRAISGG